MAPRRTLLCAGAAALTDSPSTAVAAAATPTRTRINSLFSLTSETAAEETATIATEEKKNAESFMVILRCCCFDSKFVSYKQGDDPRTLPRNKELPFMSRFYVTKNVGTTMSLSKRQGNLLLKMGVSSKVADLTALFYP